MLPLIIVTILLFPPPPPAFIHHDRSPDPEVQRLTSHALANLSVNAQNQVLIANEGGIEALIELLKSKYDLILRQAAKAIANLGVNIENKIKIASAGGIPRLITYYSTLVLFYNNLVFVFVFFLRFYFILFCVFVR